MRGVRSCVRTLAGSLTRCNRTHTPGRKRNRPLPRPTGVNPAKTTALALAVPLLLTAGCGAAAHPAAAGTPTAAPAAAASATSAPATPSLTPDQKLLAWWSSGGQHAWLGLITALDRAGKPLASGNYAGALVACANLQKADAAVRATLPVGVPSVERWMSRAVNHLYNGSVDCQVAVQDVSAPEMQATATQISLGARAIGKATTALKAVIGG